MSPLWPALPLPPAQSGALDPAWRIPSEARCAQLWDRFDMPEHIRAHSRKVALVAVQVAEAGRAMGVEVNVELVRASALLHDLAKIYCIRHGGNHSQLGGAWAMALTGNPLLAQGVVHHVYWPFEVDVRRFFAPLCVLYGDKRVAHDQIVPIEQRFGDLITRYGKTEEIRNRIHSTNRQAKEIEDAFGRLLEKNLNAHDFDRRRLVD
ncbi:MAG: phosphohydrolase [Desulfovibrionaceae bacterium CG1_02_65_16]|nr:MAG: phosphohydrolase [Desulfovibrionaceae bacterium CG1_02_65_16]